MNGKLVLPIFIFILFSCQSNRKETKEVQEEVPTDTSVVSKSKVKSPTSITETTPTETDNKVMVAIEFMPPIEDNGYYGIEIGKDLTGLTNLLHAGKLKTGEGTFEVNYILFQSDTLGYVNGQERVKSIHIWDKRGATKEGVRVGTSLGVVKELLENITIQTSEMESRVYLKNGKHLYRLNYYSGLENLDIAKIPDSTEITEIIITL